MKSRIVVLLLFCASALAQHLVPQQIFDTIATEYSGEGAQENDRQIIQYHRIQGSPMMAEVASSVVLAKLKNWGIESSLEQFPSDGKTLYQTYISPMGWEMRSGELWVESVEGMTSFTPFRLCRYSDVPMCVSTYSKGGEWSGELVEVEAGTQDKDYIGKEVKGKFALAYGYAGTVVREAAIKRGAVGVVIYPPPGDRTDHPDMVRYNGIWPRAEEIDKTVGGFQISANQYTQLRGLMQHGVVRVHSKINAALGAGQLTLVHAWIRGTKSPEVEVLLTAHLDHPKWSANDNASGSAAMLEMVRTLQTLISTGKLQKPQITIHFMWVPEYFGSLAYVTKHPEVRACRPAGWDDPRQSPPDKPYRPPDPCVAANLNLDMVGEDTVKTNSRFYITRTPDSVPGILNGVMSDIMEQTREADLKAPTGTRNHWPAEMAPYMQGSDHDVFLGLGIPSTMLGHDPDWTHHTSEDTIDKTDATEFRRVGVLTAAASYWYATYAGRHDADDLARAGYLGTADAIHERSGRIAQILQGPDSAPARKRLQANLRAMSAAIDEEQKSVDRYMENGPGYAPESKVFELRMLEEKAPTYTAGPAPRRLTLPSIYEATYQGLSGDDKAWWQAQEERFASESLGGGLPTQPTFGVITFEAINFMDGKRTTAEIADLVSVEINQDIDAVWIDRLVGILAKLNLVTSK
jgi:aminopeptidase YwaD